MRKHFSHILTLILVLTMVLLTSMQVFAADASYIPETEPVVETITLDSSHISDTEIAVDLSWKTKQDKGQWIEDLGIGEDVSSLVLVINNLDKEDPQALPVKSAEIDTVSKTNAKARKKANVDGKSQLIYFAKNPKGEWEEFFSCEGFLSGDSLDGKEITYGVYAPEMAFGIKDNPGSLMSYKLLTAYDFWCLDSSDERFGNIVTAKEREDQPLSGIKMEALKAFCNYGMILKPETESSGYPALVLNCLQLENNDGTFCGLQIPEQNMRMLVQSLDENTRVVITDSLNSLTDIQFHTCE